MSITNARFLVFLFGRSGRMGKIKIWTQTRPGIWPVSTEQGKQLLTKFAFEFSLLASK
jgi:hypothetical protein